MSIIMVHQTNQSRYNYHMPLRRFRSNPAYVVYAYETQHTWRASLPLIGYLQSLVPQSSLIAQPCSKCINPAGPRCASAEHENGPPHAEQNVVADLSLS